MRLLIITARNVSAFGAFLFFTDTPARLFYFSGRSIRAIERPVAVRLVWCRWVYMLLLSSMLSFTRGAAVQRVPVALASTLVARKFILSGNK